MSKEQVDKILDGTKARGRRQKKSGSQQKKPFERLELTHVRPEHTRRRPVQMMMDSGASSQITSLANHVCERKAKITPIYLGDGSKMGATHIGSRKVCIQTDNDQQCKKLSDILVVPYTAIFLISIPSLVKKDVGVLFISGYAVLFDLFSNNSVMGFAMQTADGMF